MTCIIKRSKIIIKVMVWLLFFVYIAMLVYFLFFCEKYGRTVSDEYHYNLMPFSEIRRYIVYYDAIGFKGFMLNIVGNVVAFIPFGFCIPLLRISYRSFFNVLLDGVLFTVCIETVQLILKVGSFDVDDMILNTLGAVIGYMCYKIVYKMYNRINKS